MAPRTQAGHRGPSLQAEIAVLARNLIDLLELLAAESDIPELAELADRLSGLHEKRTLGGGGAEPWESEDPPKRRRAASLVDSGQPGRPPCGYLVVNISPGG